jgi:hypothetical protein
MQIIQGIIQQQHSIMQIWNQEIQRHANKFQSLENADLLSVFWKFSGE